MLRLTKSNKRHQRVLYRATRMRPLYLYTARERAAMADYARQKAARWERMSPTDIKGAAGWDVRINPNGGLDISRDGQPVSDSYEDDISS